VKGWRKLHNEELHNLKASPNIIRVIKSRRMNWEEHVARMGETRNVCKTLVRMPERRRPRGRLRHRWEHNIIRDFREKVWECGLN
jgi:hypothetical protein